MSGRKFVIGQIGSGYWGPNVANSFKATERADVKWICDTRPASRETFVQRHPTAKATGSLADVLGDPEVDGVAIVTPTDTHFAITKAALEAGKHVFVEKPITTVVAEAEALAELAEQKGLVLMVGHVFQYNASILALKELIAKGELGTVNSLSLERTNLGPVRTDVSALWDLVSHDAYIMADLLGERPLAVSAYGRSYLNAGVEDVIFATFTFASGALAHVHASWLNPRKVRQITVVGSQKMAIWDDLDMKQPICIYDKRVEPPEIGKIEGSFMEYKTMVVDGGTVTPRIQLNRPLQSECEHFLDCMETGKRPISDGRVGADVVKALTAAERSMKNGGQLVEIG
jgi:predicted dehydrogenase